MWDAIDLRKIQEQLMQLFFSLPKSSIIQRHFSAILVKKTYSKNEFHSFHSERYRFATSAPVKAVEIFAHGHWQNTGVISTVRVGDFHAHLLASLTLMSMKKKNYRTYTFLLYRYWWNTRIFPFTKKSYLHRARWRYYFYLSRVRILVSPWLLTLITENHKYCCLFFAFITLYPTS